MSKLHYSEIELFMMTPKKFFRLYDAFMEVHGQKKDVCAIDEMWASL